MRKLFFLTLLIGLSMLRAPSRVSSQAGVDKDLLNEINKIKAIDNHAHPLKFVAEGEAHDSESDALPLE